MKIGILTYHRVVNVGSVVQAWCVVAAAKQLFPQARVEVIDYRPRRMERRELRKLIKRRPPFWNRRHLHKSRAVRGFAAFRLPLSPTHLTTDDPARAGAWIDAQGYDAILVGSDTVWELRHGAYSPDGVNAYFLPYETKTKKIAFAASMDPVPRLTAEQERVLQERIRWIERFDLISVRDEATRRTLIAGGVPAERLHHLPDPTLLVDWQPLVAEQAPLAKGQRPVAGVALPRREALRAHRLLREAGYEVWDWSGTASRCCHWVLPADLPVEAVLAAHRGVDLFVTDRFHGSIFSLCLAGVPVWFFESPSKWHRPDSKGRDLFERLELTGRVFRELSQLEAAAPSLRADRLPDDLQERCQRLGRDGLQRLRQAMATVMGEPRHG